MKKVFWFMVVSAVLNIMFVCNVMAKNVVKENIGGEVGSPVIPTGPANLTPWAPDVPPFFKYEYKKFHSSSDNRDYIQVKRIGLDGSWGTWNEPEFPASNVTSVKISGVDYLKVETYDITDKITVNYIPMTQTRINSLGNCEEVNEQYTICNGNKYIREKNVTENLKRAMKDVEAVAGQKDQTKENKNSAK